MTALWKLVTPEQYKAGYYTRRYDKEREEMVLIPRLFVLIRRTAEGIVVRNPELDIEENV